MVHIFPSVDHREDSDEVLMTDVVAGDRVALGILFQRYESELLGYLKKYMKKAHLAEDALQNTFLALHEKARTYDSTKRFKPWLYTIATRKAIDLLRRNGKHEHLSLEQDQDSFTKNDTTLRDLLASDDPSAESVLEGQDDANSVRDGILRLPGHERALLVLAYFKNKRYREISDLIKMPLGTVKSRINAALRRLSQTPEIEHIRGLDL